ncbi:MAG: hypothetical protein IPG18_18580 [Saprospiraceae bacterium]|nr:hypothetical protein [Saprospiraceae bacterium]
MVQVNILLYASDLGATPPVSAAGWGANASNNNVLNSANSTTIGHWTSAYKFFQLANKFSK